MSKSGVVVSVGAVMAFLLLLMLMFYYSVHGATKFHVEVCVAFRGRTECRIASADTREHAQRTAQSNACGLLVSGVTDTMQCEHVDPASVKWLEAK